METMETMETMEDAAEMAVQFTISRMREFIAQGEEYNNAWPGEMEAAVATLQMARGLVTALEALSPRLVARFDNIAFMMAVLMDLCTTLWSGGQDSGVTLDGMSMVLGNREVHDEPLN